jgi:hypothetical protein
LLAVALALVYYVGYWEISYRLRAVPNGAQFLAAVEKEGGAPGLVGYFVFRCRIMPDAFEPASAAWTIAFIGLRGLEVGFLIAGGLYAARRLAGRVFYEEYDRWASSNAFLFLPQELPAVLAAVETQEWSRLDAVEKRPPNRFHRRQGGMILRVEFLPRVGDLPVYVTVEGPRLRRAPWLLLVCWPRRWCSRGTRKKCPSWKWHWRCVARSTPPHSFRCSARDSCCTGC